MSSPVTLAESYDICRTTARRAAGNFYYSFWALPREKRLAMCALYAFFRRTDDLGDDGGSLDARRTALHSWRESLTRAMVGTFDDPLLPALGATMGSSLGFMLPVSSPCNAIVYGSREVPLRSMIRYGLALDVFGAALVVAVVWFLGRLIQ